jgi:molybdopterin converting factor small subunit
VKIYIRAFGPLQAALGKDRIELELPERTSVKELVRLLVKEWILPVRPGLWNASQEQFNLPVVVMVSNQDVIDDNQILNDGEEVFLVAPMAGG